MRKIRLFFAAAVMLLCASAALAQNVQVSGTVKETSGEAVSGAAVQLKGNATVYVMTDAYGNFTLSVPKNGVLSVSCLGYQSAEAPVNGRTTIDVVLNIDSEFLEETVIVGYGSSKKVNSLVGSVQTVHSETLRNAPSSSALDQLQGQVAGLNVLSYSGVAGDDAVSITLHGVGSIGGSSSSPLYVIDGIPSTNRSIMAMNPNDIESISVLKDASATSIYGSRASNGVIYVTTKAGNYNEKATVSLRAQYGISTLANFALYENMMSGSELMDFWVRSGIQTESYVKGNFIDNGYTHNTQWYKYFMNLNTPQTQADVTIQGGGQKVAYMVSASQFHQEGFTPGNFYDRYTVRANVQAHPMNWLKVGTNINLSLDQTQQNPNWGSAMNGTSNYTNGGLSYLLLPMYPAVDEDGNTFEKRFPGLNRVTPNYSMANNPDQYDRYGANGNVFVEIEPVKNLKITSRAGVDGYIKLNNWQTNASYTEEFGGTPSVGKSSTLEYTATITNTIEYSMDINANNKFSVLAGQEGVSSDYTYFYAQSQKQNDDRTQILQSGQQSTYAMSESNSQSRFLSFFGHADYTLFDRYIADVTVRNDASSRFGSSVRSATFWSAGIRWNLKKESFLRNSNIFNSLDFKVSYGTQGNASIGDYRSLGLIRNSGTYAETSGIAVTQPANNMLTWENQGLFTTAFSGRALNFIDFNLEFYNRETSSMLMSVPQPYTTGFEDVYQNVGELRNTGFDITLGLDIIKKSDAYLRFNTTFNYNSQKVLSLFDGRQRWEIANTGIAYVVGKPVSYYYPIYAGIDPADGLPMWYLPGEDTDVTTMDPERTTKLFSEESLTQNTGKSRYVPVNGGFSFSGGWKGLSFQADFSYVLGKNLINNDAYFCANPVNFSTMNTHKSVSDFWTPDHTDARWPDWSKGVMMQFDTHILEDASFMRLKNLQIGYSLPASILGWTNGTVKGVKFTVTGRNLLTFTKYSGIDPEINSNLTLGIAGNSKQVLGGIELTF